MSFNKAKFVLLCTAMIVFNSNTFAQVDPIQNALRSTELNAGSDLMQRMREMQRMKAEDKAKDEFQNKTEEPKTQNLQTTKPDAPKVRMYLEKLDIPDSEVLPREELDAIAAKYEKKEIEVADLYQAIDEINKLYASKGFLTTKAVIQPQKITGGTVHITLLEGKLGEYHILNNKHTRTKYIEQYLELETDKIPNMNVLRHRIQRFNGINSTILQIKMVAGKAPMTTDFYIVAVEPQNRDKFTFFSDNAGKESSGEWRYGINYSNVDASGYCDSVSIAALFAKTAETTMLSYNLPIDTKGNQISFNYSNNRMHVSHGDMRDLDIRGMSRASGVTFIHPTLTTASRKENISLDVQQQHSETSILGTNFVHDDEHRFSLSYDSLVIRNRELLYLKPTFTYNEYSGLAENQFGTKFVLDMMYQNYRKNGDIFTARFNGQKAFDDYIPSADQYYLGGLYTVRGYEESGIGGDSGLNVRLDYAWHTKIKGLKFVTFFDWGRLCGDNLPSTKEIYSTGWGIEYRRGDIVLSTTVGYALKRHINEEKVDASEIHLTFNYIF